MAETKDRERMRELAEILDAASRAYYNGPEEIMSNKDYDRLYEELEALEKKTGTVLTVSPTHKVGYEVLDELPKEAHASAQLSLDKTKDREVLRAFIGDQKTLISWKLDGLTVVLTYEAGKLQKAVTRGNGLIGEVVTGNARVFKNIPLEIPYQGQLSLRGEAVISYEDFEKINESLGENEVHYKNPRNLCAGSVRQLNNEITAKRNVRFFAFALVSAEGVDFKNSRMEQFNFLEEQGFEVVEHVLTSRENLDQTLSYFEDKVQHYPIPSDGLVALYDDIAYGESLGSTAKFPRNAFAFKWKDEEAETKLLQIEWSPSRTGLINPVAVFEPVQLEGTTVSRASVHNISIMRSLKLGIGDTITVFKANMIIPQIAENLTCSDNVKIPEKCPVCGGRVSIHDALGVQTLYCENPDCAAKKIKRFTQFVSRDAMNIDGLSEMTLEKLIGRGFIHFFGDLFRLGQHRADIIEMEGLGKKSQANLEASIEKARDTTLPRLLFGLGIPGIGVANARGLSKAFDFDLDLIRNASEEALAEAEGVGGIMAAQISQWFADQKNKEELDDLLTEIRLEKPGDSGKSTEKILEGKIFVITGDVHQFRNRRELKAAIEEAGGKVTGSVSSKTSYLINNDAQSSSSKNRSALKLGVPILTEDQFLELLKGG